MNRGSRMSSALALVTPRAVVNPDAPPDAALPRLDEEPLLIVAKVPDLRPASTASAEPSKVSWKPSWTLPTPKFRVAYLKLAAMVAGLDFATCWAWIITLPPIVKLGTIVASLVMSIWMFGDDAEVQVEPAPASAWHETETTSKLQTAADASSAAKSSTEAAPLQPATVDDRVEDAVRLARDAARSEQPTLREIQALAGAKTTSPGFDDGWPKPHDIDGSVARATVRPIPPYREPHGDSRGVDLPYDASSGRAPIEAQPLDNGPEPPADMPRRWAERPQPTDTAGFPRVQTNPHYADTAVAQTPSRTVDGRSYDNRPADNRFADESRYDREPPYRDERAADPRFADSRFAPQPTAEQLEAERLKAERFEAERRVHEANRQRAYNFSRDRAEAERPSYPESYRR